MGAVLVRTCIWEQLGITFNSEIIWNYRRLSLGVWKGWLGPPPPPEKSLLFKENILVLGFTR
jgi:hypothetical protein